MDEIKKAHSEIEKENETLIQTTTIGNFLLKNHEDVFNNMELYANDMASNTFKRFMMLNGESDGIDTVLKLETSKLYADKNFKEFILKINEYFVKIQNSAVYEKSEQTDLLEKLIYDKFRLLAEKLSI
jgi:hypothetical protein